MVQQKVTLKKKWESLYQRQNERKFSPHTSTVLEGLLFAQLKISITPTMISDEDSLNDQPVLSSFLCAPNLAIKTITEYNTKLENECNKIDMNSSDNTNVEKINDDSDNELYETIPFTFKSNLTNFKTDQNSRLKNEFDFTCNREELAPKIPQPRKPIVKTCSVSVPQPKLKTFNKKGCSLKNNFGNFKQNHSKKFLNTPNNKASFSNKFIRNYEHETVNKQLSDKFYRKLDKNNNNSLKNRRVSQTKKQASYSSKRRNSYKSNLKKNSSSFSNEKNGNIRSYGKILKTQKKYRNISLKLSKVSYQVLTLDLSTNNGVTSLNYCPLNDNYNKPNETQHFRTELLKNVAVLSDIINKESCTSNKINNAEKQCCGVEVSRNSSNIYLKPTFYELSSLIDEPSLTDEPNYAMSNLYEQIKINFEIISFDIYQPLPALPYNQLSFIFNNDVNHFRGEDLENVATLTNNKNKKFISLNKINSAEKKCCGVKISRNLSSIYLSPTFYELPGQSGDLNIAKNINDTETLTQINSNLYDQIKMVSFDIYQPLPSLPYDYLNFSFSNDTRKFRKEIFENVAILAVNKVKKNKFH
ncbi:probable cyclin-dependent serine/threonine-protein kinase DDB_G0292550 isoform X1 [Hydra vulgaris]|uniref:probable cyclin-dependent serine/threonine-protein kinase DDB_G0292550 isoform X1 n=1 Tax=Hydra vulgaris TaxID=6087 RepID=UPI001F5F41E4|nr:probable cyclin-dependent serine/threonine-protein kinase DDB_G0292550 [Hydra vulgaris]